MKQPRAKKRALINKHIKAMQLSNTQQCKKRKKKKTIQQEKMDVQNYIKQNPLEIFDFFIELTRFSNV
jgi:hypothetical protein